MTPLSITSPTTKACKVLRPVKTVFSFTRVLRQMHWSDLELLITLFSGSLLLKSQESTLLHSSQWSTSCSHRQEDGQQCTTSHSMLNYCHTLSKLCSTKWVFLVTSEESMLTLRTSRRLTPHKFTVSIFIYNFAFVWWYYMQSNVKSWIQYQMLIIYWYIGKILWSYNMFDSDMLFRDMETQEVFVFDRDGIWNKDAVEHPLINWNNTK